jgi:hypothetical protein
VSDEIPASQDTPPSVASGACHLPPCASQKREGSEGGSSLACKSPRPSRRTSRTAFTAPPPAPKDPLLAFEPYVHTAPRRNSITPERQRAFIAGLAATGIVTQAARRIGASLEALYKLRHRPGAEGFSAAWDAAIERGIARLEDCAVELAIAGEELPIVSAGKLLGTYRKHNFGHIRFVLSQRRAARWNSEGAHYANLVPGHPVFERLRRGWEAEERRKRMAELPAIRQSISDKLELVRRQAMADGSYVEEFPDEEDKAFLAEVGSGEDGRASGGRNTDLGKKG